MVALGGIMSYLHWSSDLDTGIESIDQQHRRIVDYLNELSNANSAGDMAVTNHVLNELVDYTVTHFAFEEELQEKAGYPFLRAHKRVHEIFTTCGGIQKRATAGKTRPKLPCCAGWSTIKGDDADYAGVKALKSRTGHQAAGWARVKVLR
jgi:hemerythrin